MMVTDRLKRAGKGLLSYGLIAGLAAVSAAQSFPFIRSGPEVNPLGNNPTGPSGAVFVGNRMWIGDQVFGLVRCDPLDPANIDPINTGFVAPNPGTSTPLIGKVGQIVLDPALSNTIQAVVYISDFSGKSGGVKRVTIDVLTETITSVVKIASTAGLEGNNPTALAYGPDGDLYVGFLKNGDIKRIVNPGSGTTQAVESVGTSPNGRRLRGLAFLGTSLYMATEDGLGLIPSASNIVGQIPNSVRVPAFNDGLVHVGVCSDGKNVYYATSGSIGVVFAITPIDTGGTPVSFFGVGADFGARAYHFGKAHTCCMAIDPFGGLWIGDDPGVDAGLVTGEGRLFWAPSSFLAMFR